MKHGDLSVVVHVYQNGQTYEVEFVSGAGETIALFTPTSEDIRLMGEREIFHELEFIPA